MNSAGYVCTKCNQWVYSSLGIHACSTPSYYPPYYTPYFPLYEAMNDCIGVEPFKTDAVEKTSNKSGFVTAKQKTELAELKVVFGTDKIQAGQTVFVRGDLCVEGVAKQVFEVDGVKVIFIPLKEVKLVKRWTPAQPVTLSTTASTTVKVSE